MISYCLQDRNTAGASQSAAEDQFSCSATLQHREAATDSCRTYPHHFRDIKVPVNKKKHTHTHTVRNYLLGGTDLVLYYLME